MRVRMGPPVGVEVENDTALRTRAGAVGEPLQFGAVSTHVHQSTADHRLPMMGPLSVVAGRRVQ